MELSGYAQYLYLVTHKATVRALIPTYCTISSSGRDASAIHCHPERSEGSHVTGNEILRFAQDDKRVLERVFSSLHYHSMVQLDQ